MLNNVNLDALGNYVELIRNKPEEAIAALGVTASWKGGVNTEVTTHSKKIGSAFVEKQLNIVSANQMSFWVIICILILRIIYLAVWPGV